MATRVRSKNSRKRPVSARPVDQAIVAQAGELVAGYQIVVRYDDELGTLAGRGVELPNALGFGDTADAVIEEVRGNMNALVIHMLECGETPPGMGPTQRTEQINLRLSKFEKATIESYAAAAGQGVSDYVRNAVLVRA